MLARILMLIACLGLSATLLAQTGHPAKGSWSGNLISASSDSSRLRLLINAHNGELSGTVNPGRNATTMTLVELDPSTWGLTIRATLPEGDLVLEGTLSNLGSWTNRKYRGSYTLGSEKGTFDLTMN